MSTAAISKRRGGGFGGLGPWPLFALVVAALVSVPVLVVASSVFVSAGDIWSHLAATVLPLYISNSLWLLAGVGVGIGVDVVVGVGEDVGKGARVGAGVGVGAGVAVAVGAGISVGVGVDVGTGVEFDVGTGVAVGVGVDKVAVGPDGIGVGVGSGCLIVSAKMLRESTWAWAVEAVKSTVVSRAAHSLPPSL